MPDLRSLLDEVKRRRVVRTAAIYAVVAWVVIEVASVVLPALRLPEWTLTFVVVLALLGFPLVLTLEWVFEITADGVRRTSDPGDSGVEPGPESFLLGRSGLIVVALIAVGLGTWHFWPRERPADATDAPVVESSLAVFPFDVRGGADVAYLGEGMVDLLTTKLEGTEALRPLDPRAVLTFLTREGLDPTDPDVARRVSQRFGAGHYVHGSVVEFGGRLQVKASLYSLGQGESGPAVVSAAVEGEASELFSLVDDLAVEILTGGSAGSMSRLTRLAALTTDSLAALKAYLEGESTFREGRWDEAMGRFREAVEIDSTFALSHYRLASAASWAERPDVRGPALEAALAHSTRLSPHHRMLVEAQDAYRRGEHVEATRMYREITDAYPENVEAWYQLGEVLLHEGYLSRKDPWEADPAFRRAVELDPELYPALWHLSHLASTDGREEELDSLTVRLLELNPEDHWIRAQHLLYRGGPAARDSLFQGSGPEEDGLEPWEALILMWIAPNPELAARVAEIVTAPGYSAAWRARGHTYVAFAHFIAGRWGDARASLEQAETLDRALGLEMGAYLSLLAPERLAPDGLEPLRAELAAWDGSGDEPPSARPSFETPHAGLHPSLRLFFLGLVEARLDRTEAALERAAALGATEPPPDFTEYVSDLAIVVRAEVARAEGDVERALAILNEARLWTRSGVDERLSVLIGHYYPVFLRAELLREAGRSREALRWYRSFPFPMRPPATLARLRRAQILDSLGERERAAELYREVRERWAHADEELGSVLRRGNWRTE